MLYSKQTLDILTIKNFYCHVLVACTVCLHMFVLIILNTCLKFDFSSTLLFYSTFWSFCSFLIIPCKSHLAWNNRLKPDWQLGKAFYCNHVCQKKGLDFLVQEHQGEPPPLQTHLCSSVMESLYLVRFKWDKERV